MSEKSKRTRKPKPTEHPYDPALARDNLINDTFKALEISESIPVSQMPLEARRIRGLANYCPTLVAQIERLAREIPPTYENQDLLEHAEATIKEWRQRNK